MSRDPELRTVVLGLGNPVLSDDRVGLAVVERLEELLQENPLDNVTLSTSTRGGFELLDLLNGYDRAILIDCILTVEPEPGRVHRLRLEDISGCARLVNAHEISLPEVFGLAAMLAIPMPNEVRILAIEGAETMTFSEAMTPDVDAVVEPVAREILAELLAPVHA